MDTFSKFTYWTAGIMFMVLVLVGFCILLSLPIYLLWNWLMPLFGLPQLTIWQSFGLMLLSNLLFGTYKIPTKDIFNNNKK